MVLTNHSSSYIIGKQLHRRIYYCATWTMPPLNCKKSRI